jgi:hypothetical protein
LKKVDVPPAPASPVRHFLVSGIVRHTVMGLATGAAVIALIPSPWGKPSGGHINHGSNAPDDI